MAFEQLSVTTGDHEPPEKQRNKTFMLMAPRHQPDNLYPSLSGF